MMLSEEQRQVLIADCKASIKDCLRLLEIAEGRTGENRIKRIAELQSELQRQKIALASLEAEPVGSFEYHEDEDGDKTDFIIQSDGFSKESFRLYTALPVPVMQVVDLSGCGLTSDLLYSEAVIEAIRAAGYEVKE